MGSGPVRSGRNRPLPRAGEVENLHPSDDEVDLEILEAARSAADPKAKATLYELYLNARGRSTKAATNTTVNVDARKVTNVLSVPAKMTVEQARIAFAERQSMRTITDARNSRPN